MSWLKTMRQFLTLLMGLFIVLTLAHSCIRFSGQFKQYTRMDNEVLKKINEIIYLNSKNDHFVFEFEHKENTPLEIRNMSYIHFTSMDQVESLKWTSINSECLFLDFEIDEAQNSDLDKVIDILDPKTCLFFNTPYLTAKSYISHKKPRWFYNIMETDLQKSRFLSSLGLASMAPLKGDFWVTSKMESNNHDPKNLQPTKSSVSDKLFDEIQRRDIIIFRK